MSGRARTAVARRLASSRSLVVVGAVALGLAAGVPNASATPVSADIEGQIVANWPSGTVDPGIDGFSFAMIAKLPSGGSRSLFANAAGETTTASAEVEANDDVAF